MFCICDTLASEPAAINPDGTGPETIKVSDPAGPLCDVTEGSANLGGATASARCPAASENASVSEQEAETLAGGHKHMANCAVFLEICEQLKGLHARCFAEKQRDENVKICTGGKKKSVTGTQ